jgi:hypothetical protein
VKNNEKRHFEEDNEKLQERAIIIIKPLIKFKNKENSSKRKKSNETDEIMEKLK